MYATDTFVYIHEPKTGGTFVTSVLFTLQDLLNTEQLRTRNPRTAFFLAKLKHGGCRDIPPAHRHKPVLSSIRNPYDIYVSEYEFGWWRRPEYRTYFRNRVWGFRRKYPQYPDLDFEQYVRLLNESFCSWRNKRFDDPDRVGFLTERFIKFYYPQPRRVLRALDDEYIASEEPLREMCDVHFLHTERLNEDLHGFLAGLGYPRERLAFILDLGKIRPEGSESAARRDWREYYSPELKRRIRRRERFIFRVCPEFDV